MSKVFKTLPEGFEQYNPEVPSEEWYVNESTYDDNGRLHSFNDKPVLAEYSTDKKAHFYTWYSHGKVERENNQPVNVRVAENVYSTHNANMKYHSYNDEPAIVRFFPESNRFKISWCKNGETHRDDDKPAIITIDDSGTSYAYYLNGALHRENNMPAIVEPARKIWLIKGILHNTEDYASVSFFLDFPKLKPEGVKTWGLYNVLMPESIFNDIKSFQKRTNFPLWVSFLSVLDFINLEDISLFDNEWNYDIPTSWYLHALGVTDKVLIDGLNNQALIGSYGISPFKSHINTFLATIEYEEELQKKLKEEKSA
jgi:hypothetical protein